MYYWEDIQKPKYRQDTEDFEWSSSLRKTGIYIKISQNQQGLVVDYRVVIQNLSVENQNNDGPMVKEKIWKK